MRPPPESSPEAGEELKVLDLISKNLRVTGYGDEDFL
jgi:hypothetical protein